MHTEEETTVIRQYEDFEYLHHCLLTQHNINGLIVSIYIMFMLYYSCDVMASLPKVALKSLSPRMTCCVDVLELVLKTPSSLFQCSKIELS